MDGALGRYHHLGVPSDFPRQGETYLREFGLHVTSHRDDPFGIEWMRFDADSPLPPIVKDIPHLAFQVEDLDAALAGRELLIPPNSPSPGVRVAFVLHGGMPIELLEFTEDHPDALARRPATPES